MLTGCGANAPQTDSVVTTTTSSTTTTTQSTESPTTTVTESTTQTTLNTTKESTTLNLSDATTQTTTNVTTNTTTSVSIAPSTTTTDANSITFKVTVRENEHKQTVSGVRVTVYVDENAENSGSATTDQQGVARIALQRGSSYRVELANLPSGYEANAFYTFATTTVNITIRQAAVQDEKDHSKAQYKEGRKMTDFSLTDIDGNTYQLSDLCAKKQLIVLDFWYTTCEPCKMEFPYFESAVQKYGDKLSLLAVNPINDNRAMSALRQQFGSSITFPLLKDTCNLYLGFAVTAYPTTVFIDSNGVILDIHEGAYTSEEAFLSTIQRYLH